MKKVAFIFSAIVIAVPILISVLLSLHSPFPSCIADGVWVAFWGSYLGTIGALFCLLTTIAYNKHQICLETEYKRKERKIEDIIARVGRLQMTGFLDKPLACIDDLKTEEQVMCLLKIYREYQSAQNTADLLYNTKRASEKQRLFYREYSNSLSTCVNAITVAINEIKKGSTSNLQKMALFTILASADTFQRVKKASSLYIDEIEADYCRMVDKNPWRIFLSIYSSKY